MGYHRAGFDVTGVDISPQPHYPFEFVHADAMTVLDTFDDFCWAYGDFDAIHASPPCQAFSKATRMQGNPADHPDLLTPTRERLRRSGVPWVVENVPGAPLRADFKLCGCMFGLGVRRERWFETSWQAFDLRQPCCHPEPVVGVYGYSGPRPGSGKFSGRLATWSRAMGIGWMEVLELAQAIPPAYTEHVGEHLAAHLAQLERKAS